ncbi:hypothetical protein LMH87_012152 [Akanthomyces muscarius]|uniref:Uncharacterized protein n=1 Tax=Akanthomyces muscarius TaxID=2231603 RepID=A0A9W8QDY1_AKAMU|nr:hypothetical protein LMH87_012152 [Akanthomyces muscarius]KAJ4151453.1 hypothetical protein LMH87_012152 [Akanthomyces muscarius]
MEATEQTIPHISAAKQDRILIWRSEVANASLDAESSTTNDGASSSATSTTTSSSSSRSALVVARSRDMLSKLAHKLRPSSWRGAGRRPEDDDDAVTRTAMYATLSPDYNPDDDDDDEDALDDGDAPARDAALREKQQRLMRAARLLDKEPRV